MPLGIKTYLMDTKETFRLANTVKDSSVITQPKYRPFQLESSTIRKEFYDIRSASERPCSRTERDFPTRHFGSTLKSQKKLAVPC